MNKRENSLNFNALITLSITLLITIAIIYFSGCAPVAQQQTISPERQKAIQDSIRKAYTFELDKAFSTGWEYYKSKIYARSLKPFWKVVKLDTIQRHKDIYSYLSNAYFQLNKPDSAEIVLELGVQQYPDNVGLLTNLAYIKENKEMTDEAIELYTKVVELDDANVDVWKRLGNLYVRTDQRDEAVTAYKKVVELNPQDKEAQEILAPLLSDDPEAYEEQLKEAIKANPDNPRLIYDLARHQKNQQNLIEAISNYKAYLAKEPNDNIAMEEMANTMFENEDYRSALTTYRKITEVQPENKKAFADIARCYKELGDLKTARNYVYSSIKIDKNYGYAYIALGEIYEVAVDKCMKANGRKSPKFDDKLVFQEATRQYAKAAKDLEFQSDAERKIAYLKDFLPTTEDEFFNKDRKLSNGRYKVTAECYKWIADSM